MDAVVTTSALGGAVVVLHPTSSNAAKSGKSSIFIFILHPPEKSLQGYFALQRKFSCFSGIGKNLLFCFLRDGQDLGLGGAFHE
jgi:hypothetical protein